MIFAPLTPTCLPGLFLTDRINNRGYGNYFPYRRRSVATPQNKPDYLVCPGSVMVEQEEPGLQDLFVTEGPSPEDDEGFTK